MQNNIIIGNIIALVASIIMTASGYLKSKERTIYWQAIQIGLSAVACFILEAYTGAIVNLLSLPRNILAYKDKLTLPFKLIIWCLTMILSVIFNTKGLIGYLPLVSTTVYIFLMDKLKGEYFKALVIFTLVVWTIHDFYIKSYTSGVFDIACIITSTIAIYRIRRDKNVL